MKSQRMTATELMETFYKKLKISITWSRNTSTKSLEIGSSVIKLHPRKYHHKSKRSRLKRNGGGNIYRHKNRRIKIGKQHL